MTTWGDIPFPKNYDKSFQKWLNEDNTTWLDEDVPDEEVPVKDA